MLSPSRGKIRGARALCPGGWPGHSPDTCSLQSISESPAYPGPGSASLDQVEWRYDGIQQAFHKPACYPELGDEVGNTLNPT